MPLIIEDGTCPEGATSYVSLEEADAYLIPRGLWPVTGVAVDAEACTETPDAGMLAAKEAALIRAFDYLNGPLEWLGRKVDWQRQAAWPREGVPVPGSDPHRPEHIAPDVVPAAVKQAQMELAALIYNGNALLSPVERGGKVKSVSDSSTEAVDVLNESKSHSVTYADDAPLESWLPSVYPLLKPFLADVPGEVKGGFRVLNILRG